MVEVQWDRQGLPPSEIALAADRLVVRGESKKETAASGRTRCAVFVRFRAAGGPPEVRGRPSVTDSMTLTRILDAADALGLGR